MNPTACDYNLSVEKKKKKTFIMKV